MTEGLLQHADPAARVSSSPDVGEQRRARFSRTALILNLTGKPPTGTARALDFSGLIVLFCHLH